MTASIEVLPLLGVLGALVALEVTVVAQDWTQRVQARWPGDAIRKATEVEFTQWSRGLDTDEKGAAHDAFVAQQWAAHGLPTSAARRGFLCPALPVPIEPHASDAGVLEGPEPNGDPRAIGGGVPTAIGCGDQGEGSVFPYGDRDWWQLDIAAPQHLVAWTGPGIGASIADTVLELYDAQGALLAANDDDPLRGHFSALAEELTAGRYYVAVRGYADVRTGTYSVDIACLPAGSTGGDVHENPEPNDRPATATPHGCSNIGHGSLAPGPDADWWQLTLRAPTIVTLETGPDSGFPSRDTVLYLRDASGVQLAFNDDYNGRYARIQMLLPAGVFHADVQSYAGANPGTYTLTVRCGPSSGAPATFVAFPGGCAGTAGVPRLSARGYELPILGTSLAIDVDGVLPGAHVFPFFGFSTTQTSAGIVLPFDLSPAGAPGCMLEVDPESLGDVVADASGHASRYVVVPYEPLLLGATVHFQAFVADPTANAAGSIVTNRATGVLGSHP